MPLKIWCRNCNRITNHEVLKEYSYNYTPKNTPGMSIDFADGTWQIIRCLGCEEVSFREEWFVDGDIEPEVKLYPPRGEEILAKKPFLNTPRELRRIYNETIDCFNQELNTLCAAGLRAIIEGICVQKKVKKGIVEVRKKDGITVLKRKSNLEGKISGLSEKGFLTKKHADILHGLRFLGNDALHELAVPSKDELKLAIEITEHTLENLFELSGKAFELQRKRKKRGK